MIKKICTNFLGLENSVTSVTEIDLLFLIADFKKIVIGYFHFWFFVYTSYLDTAILPASSYNTPTGKEVLLNSL